MEASTSATPLERRLKALQRIAVELMEAQSSDQVLSLIVDQAVDLLECDGGSLFLRHDEKDLVFEVAINRSISFDFQKRRVPVLGNGIATYSYRCGEALRLDDVYAIPPNVPYQFDSSFDKEVGYRTKSVLCFPLKSSKGEMLGVIQLINRKQEPEEPWPSDDAEKISRMPAFLDEDEELIESFAALASAAIENSELYASIENLFEGFLKASVDAIETRDPATRGHSERVALLSIDLAEKVSRSDDFGIREIHFNERQIGELRFASLLHDFGKIGTREETLLKAEKLYPQQQERIQNRFDGFVQMKEIRLLRELVNQHVGQGRELSSAELDGMNRELEAFQEQIGAYWSTIMELNEPSVLTDDKTERLQELLDTKLSIRPDRHEVLLTPDEIGLLSIQRGSLSAEERHEIELHVTNTFHFLSQIPWTPDYAGVPDIAHAHHEKLNGKGYPRGLAADDIPLQSRIMTICDIYDALVAADRPYKKSVPVEKALAILESEVKGGALDPRFLKVFIEGRVYQNPMFAQRIEQSGNVRAA